MRRKQGEIGIEGKGENGGKRRILERKEDERRIYILSDASVFLLMTSDEA